MDLNGKMITVGFGKLPANTTVMVIDDSDLNGKKSLIIVNSITKVWTEIDLNG